MRLPIICLVLLAAACQAPVTPTFDIKDPKLGADIDPVTLKGWLQIGEDFRLYPLEASLGETGKGTCITGRMLSLAGILTPDMNNKLVTVSGYVAKMGTADVGDSKDDCGSGKILMAMNLELP